MKQKENVYLKKKEHSILFKDLKTCKKSVQAKVVKEQCMRRCVKRTPDRNKNKQTKEVPKEK